MKTQKLQMSSIQKIVWKELNKYLTTVGNREIYGLTIGQNIGNASHHQVVIFPEQLHSSPTLCAMKIEDLSAIMLTLANFNKELPKEKRFRITSWIHTHPNLTVFLSDTDKETLIQWHQTMPELLAVVVDPYDVKCKVKSFTDCDMEIPTLFERQKVKADLSKKLLGMLCEALPKTEAIFTPHGNYIAAEAKVIPSSPEIPEAEKMIVRIEEALEQCQETLSTYKEDYQIACQNLQEMHEKLTLATIAEGVGGSQKEGLLNWFKSLFLKRKQP